MAAKSPREIWRDYVTDGVPSTGNHNPVKGDIREWAESLQAQVSYVYDDLAALNANLVPVAGSRAEIRGDSDSPSNNGIYQKVGGTGTGSWTKIDDLPDVVADNDITNSKLANMAEARIKGRVTSGSGDPEDLTAAQVRTIINVEDAADVTDAGNVGSSIHGASAKTTPVDADTFAGIDSDASNVLKKFTWANIKATMKAYLDPFLDAKAAISDVSQRQGRPGDVAPRFASTLTGAGSAASAPPGSVTTNSFGSILRVTGAGIVGTRERIATEPGRSYRVRWVIRRQTDPTDPAGDTVRCGIQWLTNAKADNGTLIDGSLDTVLTVADGRTVITTVVAEDDPVPDSPPNSPPDSVNYEWPAGTRYMVPFVQTFGLDGVTDIELIEWVDITDLANVQVDISDAVEAELFTKQDKDSFLTSLSGNSSVPLALGGTAATSAVGAADNIATVGSDIASASTTSIGGATGNMITVTGTTTITAFGSTGSTGTERTVRFTSSLLLTHSSGLVLPGGVDIQTTAGDYAVFRKTGASTWQCVSYSPYRANLAPVTSSSGVSDENHPIAADGNGKMSYTFLPGTLATSDDEKMPDSGGDGVRALTGINDTAKAEQIGPWASEIGELAGQPRLRPKVYLMGDSRCNNCSGEYQTEARGWLWWLGALTGWRFDFQLVQNHGIGGTEVYEIQSQAVTISELEPGIVIGFESTNDRTASGVTNAIASMQGLKAQQDVVTAKHALVWFAEQPRGDGNGGSFSGGLTSSDLYNHLRVAQWFREQRGVKGVYVADPWPLKVNTASSTLKAIDTVYYDGLHDGVIGARLSALAAQPIIEHLLPERPLLPFTNYDTYTTANTSGNLLDNGMMTGTGGTKSAGLGATPTGVLADGWTCEAGTGLTVALSQGTDANGYPEQIIAITGTPSGTSSGSSSLVAPLVVDPVSAVLTYTLTDADVADGDVLEAVCRFKVDSSSSGLRGVPLYIISDGTGVDNLVCGGEPNMANNSGNPNLRFPSVEIEGVNMTPEFTVPAGYTALSESPAKSLKVKICVCARGSEAISATVRIGRVSVRKVRS